MIVDCYSGTPHHGETKRFTEPSKAKGWLVDRVTRQMKVAEKFDAETHRRLGSIRQEVDSLAVAGLPLKETRQWSVVDDYTKVEYVFKIVRMSS